MVADQFDGVGSWEEPPVTYPLDFPEHPLPTEGLDFWVHCFGCRDCVAANPRPLAASLPYFTDEHREQFRILNESRMLNAEEAAAPPDAYDFSDEYELYQLAP